MKKFASLLTVILAAVVMMGATQAAKAEAAAYPLKKISPQEVAVLLETQRPIAIIDVRSLPDFKAGHIPTAESLPFELMMDAMTFTSRIIDRWGNRETGLGWQAEGWRP